MSPFNPFWILNDQTYISERGKKGRGTNSKFPPKELFDRQEKKMHIYAEIKEGNLGEQTCLFSQLSQYASDKINTVGPSVLYSLRECLQFRRNTSPSPPLRLLVKRTAVQALLHEPHQWTEGTPRPSSHSANTKEAGQEGSARTQAQGTSS